MLEATVIPLSSLPTAHPSPEVARVRTGVVRRPGSPSGPRSTRLAPRFTVTAAAVARTR
jgi:hypothetical protein